MRAAFCGLFALSSVLLGAYDAQADVPGELPPQPESDAPVAQATEQRVDDESTVSAEDDDEWEDETPARIWVSLGAGSSVRLARNRDFAQDTFAPSYIDAFGALILPWGGFWRHGVGIGVSGNMASDGSVFVGVDAFEQIVLTPTYVARLEFSPEFLGTLKAGVPWALSPQNSVGLEVDIGATWLFLSGFGVYAEVGCDLFVGGEGTVHPLASGELGLVLDYEVLP